MAAGIVDYAFIAQDGGVLGNPVAGMPCYLAMAWGPGLNATVTASLSISGATVDPAFSLDGVEPHLDLGGYVGINAGWHPTQAIWLGLTEAAYGLWKVTFPSAASYTLNLANVGTQGVTSVAAPAAAARVTLTLLHAQPIGLLPAKLFHVAFDDTYPAGGIGLDGNQLGLSTPFFGHIDDTATLRFSWSRTDEKLRVYDSSGEVSGAVSFTTRGIWHGSAN